MGICEWYNILKTTRLIFCSRLDGGHEGEGDGKDDSQGSGLPNCTGMTFIETVSPRGRPVCMGGSGAFTGHAEIEVHLILFLFV